MGHRQRRNNAHRFLQTSRRHAAAAVIGQALLAPVALTAVGAAHAQTQEARLSFAIPAGPLAGTLVRFGQDTGLMISYKAADIAGKRSAAVQGSYTPAQALRALFEGTGLQAVAQPNGGYAVQAAAPVPVSGSTATTPVVAARDAALPQVTVKADAERESAWGGVQGYVAKRSATGTKTDTALIEIPRSVSVIPREQIEAQRPISLQDALGYTPGIYAPPLAASSTDSTSGMSVRGFRTQDGDAYYQDGMRAKFSGWWGFSGCEPYAFERIEVLRGPASILYGQGQPNGTINLVSKRPTATPVREVGLEVGSFDHKQLTADLGGSLTANGDWSYRLTALARHSGTQIDFSDNNRSFVSAALAWRPRVGTELILRAGYQRNEGESNNNLPQSGTLLPNPNGTIPRHRAIANDNSAHYDNKTFGWQFEHAVDEVWTLRSNMRLSQQTGERHSTRSNGYQAGQSRIINRGLNNYESLDGNYGLLLDNQAQARFQLGGVEHTLLVGLDHARQKDGWQMSGGTAAPVDLFAPVYTPVTFNRVGTYERTANDRQIGLYLQDQIKVDKRWVVSVGGRKDWARSGEQSGTPGANNASSSQKDDATTWQAGLAYLFDSGWTPYASYAESFVPTLGNNFFGDALRPETGRQYEAGVKYQPVGSNTLLTAAVFDIRRQNVTTADPVEPRNRIQTGEVSSRGIELEARSEMARGLTLVGSYTHLRAKVSKSNDADLGKELIQSPRNTAALWLEYALPDTLLAGLSVGAGARYIGATWSDTANTTRVPGYTLLDLALRYDLGRAGLPGAQVYLSVKNLADKTYMSCFFGNCLYGLERSVTAGMRYHW